MAKRRSDSSGGVGTGRGSPFSSSGKGLLPSQSGGGVTPGGRLVVVVVGRVVEVVVVVDIVVAVTVVDDVAEDDVVVGSEVAELGAVDWVAQATTMRQAAAAAIDLTA